jgi:hypothetical protein
MDIIVLLRSSPFWSLSIGVFGFAAGYFTNLWIEKREEIKDVMS